MIEIDLKSRKSIYEQVVTGIKEQILTGLIAAEAKLPSVRELSKELTVNPNTIQKAFRKLEEQGYIYSVTGVGSFAHAPQDIRPDHRLLLEAQSRLRDDLRELRLLIPDDAVFNDVVAQALEEMGVSELSPREDRRGNND
ncbi:MAG: GntR family transcriptional regulator [Bifidobacterium psychraerophilum]|uniref:GntR family transcriptional regulator n=1 Tax=Bifidobacterium psychraerophilum TaxID=218140 RepID=UPI0039EB5DEE